MRHVASLLKMWFGDYILPELCHLSHFFYRKGVGFYSPTPNIIEPIYSSLGVLCLLLTLSGDGCPSNNKRIPCQSWHKNHLMVILYII